MNRLSNKNVGLILAAALIFMTLAACAPYQAGRSVHYKASGDASWYGPGFAGKKTSNGEKFDPRDMTAAHKTLPFGTTLKVTNLDNGKSCVVRVNDRGPFIGDRILDLSKAAAEKIGMVGTGTAPVEIIALSTPKAVKEAEKSEKASGDNDKASIDNNNMDNNEDKDGVSFIISKEEKNSPSPSIKEDEKEEKEEF